MTVEQIAIRQEIRQMLCEAGINKETLTDMTKGVISEEMQKAIKRALNETNTADNISRQISNCVDKSVNRLIREEIRDRVNSVFNRMTISIDITDENGQSSITR